MKRINTDVKVAKYRNFTYLCLKFSTKIFKKLQDEIWEFRSKYLGNQHRLLAFWDKSNNRNTLVIATHGFIKKTSKVPKNEIQKAEKIRSEYFSSKK